MPAYSQDRQWSDRYLDAIRRIVGPLLLVPAPLELDTRQNTDLMVLTARNMTIAARVRRAGFAQQYPYDVTLRYKRDSGAATELEKIVAGWGDWMFYGHAGAGDVPSIQRWMLLDLAAIRREWIREGIRSALDLKPKYRATLQRICNYDGTHFVAFDVRTFPSSILIAASESFAVAA